MPGRRPTQKLQKKKNSAVRDVCAYIFLCYYYRKSGGVVSAMFLLFYDESWKVLFAMGYCYAFVLQSAGPAIFLVCGVFHSYFLLFRLFVVRVIIESLLCALYCFCVFFSFCAVWLSFSFLVFIHASRFQLFFFFMCFSHKYKYVYVCFMSKRKEMR